MSDAMQTVEIRRYRVRDEKRYGGPLYGADEPEKAEEAANVVADLYTRVNTLRTAHRDVVVSIDGSHLVLSTRVPAPQPVAPPAAKRRSRPSRNPR